MNKIGWKRKVSAIGLKLRFPIFLHCRMKSEERVFAKERDRFDQDDYFLFCPDAENDSALR